MRVLNRLGIGGDMKSKIKLVDGSKRTADLLLNGQADIAVQLMSELAPVSGIQVVGPFPPGLDNTVVFSAGLLAGAKEREAAKAFARFLSQPAITPALKEKGMEPSAP